MVRHLQRNLYELPFRAQ